MPIAVEELGRLVRGRIGLVIGPAVTHYSGILNDLSASLARAFQVEQGRTYLQTGELAIEAGHELEVVRKRVEEFLSVQQPAAVLGQLIKVHWSAIFSASFDLAFEDRLRQEYDRRPLRHEVTVASDLTQSIPPRSIPVFKLLGGMDRGNVVCTEFEYHQRRATWRSSVRLFIDLLRAAPILCLGMSDCPWALNDLLVEMLGNPVGPSPNLLILSEDPLAGNQLLQRLVSNRMHVESVNASLGHLMSAIESAQTSSPSTVVLPAGDVSFDSLRRFASFGVVVNEHLTTDVKRQEHQRLQDLLFSPTVTRWAPYVYGMDFPRTAAGPLLNEIEQHLATLRQDIHFSAAIVTGSVASGKTVLLKRVSFALAEKGHLVLWLKPSYFPDTHTELLGLFKAVARLIQRQARSVVVFMDDPLSFGGIAPKGVVAAARAADVSILLCVAVRSSEWLSRDPDDIYAALPVAAHVDLPDSLDGAEWAALPQYLVDLGVEPDLTSAQQQVAALESRATRDTLSMLYWLLPGTKPIISSAIRDEFFRLGDTAGLARVLIGAAQHTSQMLKDAYEMVAVSANLGAPVPVEALVSALGVPYTDWLDVANSKGPVWGFLYSEDSEDGSTVLYRPRNAIVTNVIVNAINGGSFSHSGEARVMRRLLDACTGSQLVYREYCIQVLVKSDAIDRFEFGDGLALFDSAIEALPYEDRTLLHHKGLWIKNKGNDPVNADKVLRQALEAKKYPYVVQDEADGYIYTSLAATTLDAIDRKLLTLEEGKSTMLGHLAKAKAREWFNYKAVHVQANLTTRLAAGLPAEQRADLYTLVNQAIADIDRTLLLLLNPLEDRLYAENAIQMLQTMREKVLTHAGSLDDVKQDAVSQWAQYGRQDGFAVAARRLYERAKQSNKGSAFKEACDYCVETMTMIRSAGREPIPGLVDAALHIYYHWRVQRTVFFGSGAEIDWELIRASASIVLQSGEPSAPFYYYLQALALAHLNRWADANAIFTHMRMSGDIPSDLLWTPRDFLLNPGGGRQKVQGTIRRGASRTFLHVESLGWDFHVDRNGYWPEDGEVDHAYIRFSFAGPTAVQAQSR